jgi:hemoglobin-like flavoprotein
MTPYQETCHDHDHQPRPVSPAARLRQARCQQSRRLLQKVRFAEKLTEIVRAFPRLPELLAHTRALGARHAGHGVRVADYQTVCDALLAALAAMLGDAFDAPTREAWVTAYNLVAETMLEGAASARPIGA